MLRRFGLIAAIAASFAPSAHCATRYRLVDLGFVPGASASAPNRFGQGGVVLGWFDIPGTFGGHAARWDVSATGTVVAATDLQGLPGFDWSSASGMNAGGWVVGWSNTADPQPRPVLWRNGELIDLDRGGDGNANVYAFDVNGAGVICGMITKSGGGGGWDACLWEERAGQGGRFDRSFLPMHPSGDPVFGWTEAQAITEQGLVMGRTNLGVGDRATLWLADATHTPVLLEPLANSNQSMPGDINNAGDAVGYTMYPFGLDRPTRWSRDSLRTPGELPIWPGHNSGSASVVNPAGDIVLGRSVLVDTSVFPWVGLESRIVLWQDGNLYDLNQQLDASGEGWTIEAANDMNADNWIAATARLGGVSRAVLLIPIAEPLAVAGDSSPGAGLARPWPSPGSGAVRLAFSLASEGAARLTIHDLAGRQVACVADGRFTAGRHDRTWSGLDDHGNAAGPGVYFAALETGGRRQSQKLVRVR